MNLADPPLNPRRKYEEIIAEQRAASDRKSMISALYAIAIELAVIAGLLCLMMMIR